MITIQSCRPHRGQLAFRGVGKEEKEVSLECVHVRADGVKALEREIWELRSWYWQWEYAPKVLGRRKLIWPMNLSRPGNSKLSMTMGNLQLILCYMNNEKKNSNRGHFFKRFDERNWKSGRNHKICMFMWISKAESVCVCVCAVCLWVTHWMSLMWYLVPLLVPF